METQHSRMVKFLGEYWEKQAVALSVREGVRVGLPSGEFDGVDAELHGEVTEVRDPGRRSAQREPGAV